MKLEPDPTEAERQAIEAALADAEAEPDPRGAWWHRGVEENAAGEP